MNDNHKQAPSKAPFNPPKLTRATVVSKQMKRTPEPRVIFIQPGSKASAK
jgi:hypothetical protein